MVQGVDLVTGATGFIGGHLAERLIREGRRVRVLARKGSEEKLPASVMTSAEVVSGDLRDFASLGNAVQGAARVFHCAGHVSDWGAEKEFRALNVEAVRVLLEASLASGVARFVHLSSIAAFGTPSPKYFDDESPYGEGRDLYSRTKAEGDRLALEFHRAKGLPVTVLRPAVVYGPRGTWLEEPLEMIRRGKMFLLGGGEGTCHPCYIENLIDAMSLAAAHPAAIGRGYIVTDGEAIRFREYFDAIAGLASQGPITRSIPLAGARALARGFELAARITGRRERPLLTLSAVAMVTTRSRTSIARIQAELGFRPRYDFRGAIAELSERRSGGDSP